MQDRRKQPRKKLTAFTPVYLSEKRTLLGYVRDLNLQGAMVIGEKALETGTQLTLEINFPGDLPGISATQVTLPARVVRCIPDNSPRSFNLGFEFSEVGPEQARILQALLDRYHFGYQVA